MTTFSVKAETYSGNIVTLRSGFASRGDAEDHPIRLGLWSRVWIEEEESQPPAPATLPARPWVAVTSVSVSGNGQFHIYIADASGRKIAAIWGRGEEKLLIAEAILDAINQG